MQSKSFFSRKSHNMTINLKRKLLVAVSIGTFLLHGAAQTITQVAAPKLISVPVTFAKGLAGWDPGPKVSFSADGQYLMAYTELEAKVWRMPEGALIYRFNTALMKDDPNRGLLNYMACGIHITSDEKYLYTHGGTGQDYGLMPMDIETGQLLANGRIKDSLRNGSYQYRRELINSNEASVKMREKFKSLKIVGAQDFNMDDNISVYSMIPSADYPGEVIVAFWRSFTGNKNFIKEHMTQSVKQVRAAMKSRGNEKFIDIHAARYNPKTNTAVYLGNMMKGVVNADVFEREFYLFLSPIDDIACIQGVKSLKKTAYDMGIVGSPSFTTVNSYSGNVLWDPATTLRGQFSFDGFNDFGFPVFKVLNEELVASKFVFEPGTGKVLHRYTFSTALPKRYVHNLQWNAVVAVEQLADKSWTLALYDGTTGKHLLSFPDEQASLNVAAAKDAEIKRHNDYVNAAQKAMHDSWDRQMAENAAASLAFQQQKAREAADHAANYKPCPLCKGTGVWVNTGVAKAYRKTSYSEGRALDGSRTTIKHTESSTGGYWEQRGPCLKCSGRGEVRR